MWCRVEFHQRSSETSMASHSARYHSLCLYFVFRDSPWLCDSGVLIATQILLRWAHGPCIKPNPVQNPLKMSKVSAEWMFLALDFWVFYFICHWFINYIENHIPEDDTLHIRNSFRCMSCLCRQWAMLIRRLQYSTKLLTKAFRRADILLSIECQNEHIVSIVNINNFSSIQRVEI
jgi:hypothetical protein